MILLQKISYFIRLIINITSPILLIYNEQIPTDKMQRTIYQKLISYTQEYKIALTDDRIWAVLSNRLSEILKLVSCFSLYIIICACLEVENLYHILIL